MGLESVTNIADLVRTNPTGSDPKSAGDDHIRNLKTALLNDIVGFPGAVTVTGTDGGAANAYTLTPAYGTLVAYGNRMLTAFSPIATNTGAVTLNISGLGAKNVLSVSGAALIANDLVAGNLYAAFYNGTEFRLLSITKNYADQLAFSATLPSQAGNAGKFITTDGTSASWTDTFTIPITFSSRLNEAKGANIASAATINLTTATGNLIHITGNTGPITAITIPVGAERTLIFDSTPTLTHSASLLLPGTANITAAAGDRCIVRGDTAGANVIDYIPANGRAVSAITYGLSAPLATLVPTAAANVDALNVFVATYDNYVIIAEDIKPNGTDQLRIRFANAGVVDTGANYSGFTFGTGSSGGGGNQLTAGPNNMTSTGSQTGRIEVHNVNSVAGSKAGNIVMAGRLNNTPAYASDGGLIFTYNAAATISGIRFYWNGGSNFVAGGVIRIYGYNNT